MNKHLTLINLNLDLKRKTRRLKLWENLAKKP